METGNVVELARELVGAVRGLDPRGVDAGVARELMSVLSLLERLVSARRLAAASVLTKENCGERNVAVAVARAGGFTIGRAKEELRTSALIRSVEEVESAVMAGEVSSHVGGVIAGAAAHDPDCVGKLRRIAEDESLEALREEARRIARRAKDEGTVRNREAQAHAMRRCSIEADDRGGVQLKAYLPLKDGSKVKAAVDKVAAGRSTEAARAGHHEDFTHHMADALCELILGGGGGVDVQVFVHASAGALKRDDVGPGECCEVEGLGEISLAAAREYMDEGLVSLLVEEGASVLSIARASRYLTPKVRDVLIARDRRCVVPGCGSSFGLEFHHFKVPFRRGGRTSVDNLCRLCAYHHALTEQGCAITGGPGAWVWHDPRIVRRC